MDVYFCAPQDQLPSNCCLPSLSVMRTLACAGLMVTCTVAEVSTRLAKKLSSPSAIKSSIMVTLTSILVCVGEKVSCAETAVKSTSSPTAVF